MKNLKSLAALVLALAMTAFAALAHAQYSELYTFNCYYEGCNPYYADLMAQGQDGNLYGTLPAGASSWFEYPIGGVVSINLMTNSSQPNTAYAGFMLGAYDGNLYGASQHGGAAVNGSSYGALFTVSPATGGLTRIYSFTGGSNGSYPLVPPIQGPDGNLYGVTCDPGSTGYVYQVLMSTTPATSGWVHQLPSCSRAPLIFASDGNMYGTVTHGTFPGIPAGGGTGGVFQVTLAGVVTGIYNLNSGSVGSSADGDNPWGPVMQASDGNLYGTTTYGGGFNDGVVYQLKLNGTYKVIHNFQAIDGTQPNGGLVQGSDGDLYGLTSNGGLARFPLGPAGTLFKVDTAGANFVRLFNFYGDSTGKGPGYSPSATPTLHTSGLIYGLTYKGGTTTLGTAPNGQFNNAGELFSYNAGLSPFISVVGWRSAHVGDTVEIVGQGFLNATGVKFGSGSVPWTKVAVHIWSDSYMTVTVPTGATTGLVTVSETTGSFSTLYNFVIAKSACTIICGPHL